jgi:hypothetical protein
MGITNTGDIRFYGNQLYNFKMGATLDVNGNQITNVAGVYGSPNSFALVLNGYYTLGASITRPGGSFQWNGSHASPVLMFDDSGNVYAGGGLYAGMPNVQLSTATFAVSPSGAVTANGPITFIALGAGVVHVAAGGALSSSPVNLATDVTGVLPPANGGSGVALTGPAGGLVYQTSSSLAVSAVGQTGQALLSGGTGAPTWFNPSVGTLIYAGGNGALSDTGGHLFWDSSNHYLGINAATPQAPLDVVGSNGGAGWGQTTLRLSGMPNDLQIHLINNGSGGRDFTIGSTNSGSLFGEGKFVIGDATAGATQGVGAGRLIIDSNGNVGIGTYAPAAALHLNSGSFQIGGTKIADSGGVYYAP